MREILFRAKRLDNREWIEGDLVHAPDGRTAISTYDDLVETVPETVCQWTGLTDKDSRKIFEGDILEYTVLGEGSKSNYCVFWDEVKLEWGVREVNLGGIDDFQYWDFKDWEVIGNIFDNPELLQGTGT
ncbi:YopX family protein [Lachnospiraceae bacterium 46-15]